MKPLAAIVLLLLGSLTPMAAQDSTRIALQERFEELKGALDGTNETVTELKNTLDALKKIKLSGYLQTQFQSFSAAGGREGSPTSGQNAIGNFSGGTLPKDVASRFSVRRGRIKFNYDNDLTQYVLQLDVTQGGVGIKDAYLSITEPWLRTVSLWAGVFDRPFGYEVSFSSGARETPERSRLFQSLFPGERELGMKIEVNPQDEFFSHFNLKVGLFNGMLNTANENDNNKDVIGRIGFQLPFQDEGLAIDGGVSVYLGNVRNTSKFVSTVDNGTKRYAIDSTASNAGSYVARTYYGADVQIYYDTPILGGTTLRAEYITGEQPGSDLSNLFFGNPSNPAAVRTGLFKRNMAGYYVNLVQNVGLNNQFIAKYDVLDPNTDVKGGDIGTPGIDATALSYADIRFATAGIGWIHHWDANVKFVLYYEQVSNETVNAAVTVPTAPATALSAQQKLLLPYVQDQSVGAFTFRIQYRF